MRTDHDTGARAGRLTRWAPLALLAAVLAAWVSGTGRPAAEGRAPASAAAGPLTRAARRGEFVHAVRAPGKLRAEKTTNVTSRLSGHFIVDIVAEGTAVSEGDVIIKLDREGLEESVLDVKADIAAAEAALAAAQAAARRTEADVDAGIEELQAKLAVAEARLAMQESKPLPERRRAAEAALKAAEAMATYTEFWLAANRQLHEDGIVSWYDAQGAELAHHTAVLALQQARKALDETLKGAKPEDLEAAKAQLKEAQLGLNEARATKGARIIQAQTGTRSADNALQQLNTRLAQLQQDLEKTQIRAAHGGRVYSHEGTMLNVGDHVGHGAILAELADTSSLIMEAEVRECDSQLIEVDRPAQVRALARRGRRLQGSVSSKEAALAQDEAAPDVHFLRVKIKLDDVPAEIRHGMSGQADIEVMRIADALLIPQSALMGETVTVDGPAGPEVRQVEVLGRNGTEAAIGAGLQEGEHVWLCPEE